MSSQQKAGFLDLPGELRNKIYVLVLQAYRPWRRHDIRAWLDNEERPYKPFCRQREEVKSLSAACRQVRSELRHHCFRRLEFEFRIGGELGQWTDECWNRRLREDADMAPGCIRTLAIGIHRTFPDPRAPGHRMLGVASSTKIELWHVSPCFRVSVTALWIGNRDRAMGRTFKVSWAKEVNQIVEAMMHANEGEHGRARNVSRTNLSLQDWNIILDRIFKTFKEKAEEHEQKWGYPSFNSYG